MNYINNIEVDLHELPEDSATRKLIKNIIEIIEYKKDHPELKQDSNWQEKMFDRFKDFSTTYFHIFMILLDDNINFELLQQIFKVKAAIELKKISSDTGNHYLTELISEKFLYPTFGSKKEFQQKLIEASQNINRNVRRKTVRENKHKEKKQAKNNSNKKMNKTELLNIINKNQ